MNKLWLALGRVGGYISWLPVEVVIRFTIRTRILVICHDEVLIMQGWLGTNRWSLPGGGQQHGEKPAATAVRELKEEVGIITTAQQLQPLGLMKQTRGHTYKFYGFVLELDSKPKLHLQKSEVAVSQWVTPVKLRSLPTKQHVELLVAAWQKQR